MSQSIALTAPVTAESSEAELRQVAAEWLNAFHETVLSGDTERIEQLFHDHSWWRDRLAFSWDLRALGGPDAAAAYLAACPSELVLEGLQLSDAHPVSFVAGPAGRTWIQAVFTLETSVARGRGILRLTEEDGQWRAWTLLTGVDELKGFEEANGQRRPVGVDHGAHRAQANWRDQRDETAAFTAEDPTVVILGGGQGGLTLAARLGQLGVPTLIVERNDRIGDSWRKRYRSLVLHDPVWANHLPYLPFPSTWPVFTPRDKIADWMEFYAHTLELNTWTGASLESVDRDDAGVWTVRVRRADGSERVLHPRHFVIATGTSSLPYVPEITGESNFAGEVFHSSKFTDRDDYAGKQVVILGASNSAHDIAHDLVEQGAKVTMVQRSKTYVMSSKNGLDVQLAGVFEEGGPDLEDADLIGASFPLPVLFELQLEGATPEINRRDADMLAGLERAGFRTNQLGVSVQELFQARGGGYYINVGASEAIIEGRIQVRQGVEIDHLTADGVAYTDGTTQQADVVIYATGYQNMREISRLLLGNEVADQVAPVWGLDAEGELSGVWRRSGYDGLWFMGGNLNLIRPNSQILALQIKAIEEGLAPR